MKIRKILLLLACTTLVFGATGCHKEPKQETEVQTESETESESETETETETESESESESETETEKETESETEKKSEAKTNTRTTLTPSSVNGTTGTQTPSGSRPSAGAASNATDVCPYCGNSFPLANNTYSSHVAQEKSWSEYMSGLEWENSNNTGYDYNYGYDNSSNSGYGNSYDYDYNNSYNNGYNTGYGNDYNNNYNNGYNNNYNNNYNNQQNNTYEETSQCPYCYQWFTVADGSYYSHMQAEYTYPDNYYYEGEETYVICPYCGHDYIEGPGYAPHYCY